MELMPSSSEHRPALEAFLHTWNAVRVARRDEVVDSLTHPAVLAVTEGELVGVATYVIDGDQCELLTLHVGTQHRGTGTALVIAVQEIAREAQCRRLWVVTTNDNTDALRFYQRRGFHLAALRPGAVDRSRQMSKPEIPRSGLHGIPLPDELELEMTLAAQ